MMTDLKKKLNSAGFTLIEMIAGLALLGIIGVFGSMFLANMLKSYHWADDNAHLTQKAQVALTRMAVETSYADHGTVTITGNSVIYDATYPDGSKASGTRIERDGDQLHLIIGDFGYTLTDRVVGFEVTESTDYFNFTVTLTMKGANDVPKVFQKTFPLP